MGQVGYHLCEISVQDLDVKVDTIRMLCCSCTVGKMGMG